MGVLNLSPNSPYTPSVFSDPVAAARYVDEELVAEGADIVDIGLETANKRHDVRTAEWELDRLDLALKTVRRIQSDPVLSIETRYHEVADEALAKGFDMVNDICGFADPKMPDVCEAHDAAVVKMASPPDLERPGAVRTVDEIYTALERDGLTANTIVDPAFGGWSEEKTIRDDHEIFRRLREFRALGQPLLISINRKNFLGELVGRDTPDRLPASLAATALAIDRGTHVIRTHDVEETRDAAVIGSFYARERAVHERVVEVHISSMTEAKRYLERYDMDPDLAGDSITRVFHIRDLSMAEQTLLATTARACGVEFATGESQGYLAGTPRELSRLSESIRTDAPDIACSLVEST